MNVDFTTALRQIRKNGTKITVLPTRRTVKSRIHRYITNKHRVNVSPRMEEIRKSIGSPTTGWNLNLMRRWTEDMGFQLTIKDRVKIS
jgi:hypothetical protein